MKTSSLFWLALASLFPRALLSQSIEKPMDNSTFKRVLTEQFSSIVTGQSKSKIGNFAEYSVKDSELSFSGNTITKNGQVLGLKASGSIEDGLFAVFQDASLNTNISLEGQVNLLQLKGRKLTYYRDSYEKYEKKQEEIEEKYRLIVVGAENRQGLINLGFQQKKTSKKLQDLRSRLIPKLETKLADSLNMAIALLLSDSIMADSAIRHYPPVKTEVEDLENARSLELKELEYEPDIMSFDLSWLSFGYKIANKKFKLFYPGNAFAEQVKDSSFASHDLSVQYNYYKWSDESNRTFYFASGLTFSISDNLEDLKTREVSETTNYGPNPNDRAITRKYNVKVGDYETNGLQCKIYADYYKFLFNNNIGALHLYPEVKFREKHKPTYNLGMGFLFAFKKANKEDKSVVNAELYYNLLDLTKNTDTDLNLFKRNNIGLRFTFPINFVTK